MKTCTECQTKYFDFQDPCCAPPPPEEETIFVVSDDMRKGSHIRKYHEAKMQTPTRVMQINSGDFFNEFVTNPSYIHRLITKSNKMYIDGDVIGDSYSMKAVVKNLVTIHGTRGGDKVVVI